jgi:nicotinamidase-related amidase
VRHPHALDQSQTALVIVDVQEAFRAPIPDLDTIAARIATMTEGAKLLKLPILITEQVPQKLGRTLKPILDALPPDTQISNKTAFSSCGASAFMDQLRATQARQLLLAGIETHVCINQTAHDLLAAGYQVHLLADCTASRSQQNRDIALKKLLAAGVIPASVEMALFELLRDATHEQFRAIQKLIR